MYVLCNTFHVFSPFFYWVVYHLTDLQDFCHLLMLTLCRLYVLHISSPSFYLFILRCLFLNLKNRIYQAFILWIVFSVSCLQSPYPEVRKVYIFSSRRFILLLLTFNFLTHPKFILLWREVGIPFYSFPLRTSNFSSSIIK